MSCREELTQPRVAIRDDKASLLFDGVDDKVEVADNATLKFGENTDFTLSCNFLVKSVGSQMSLLRKGDVLDTYLMRVSATGNIVALIGDGSDTVTLTSTTVVKVGNFYDAEAVFDRDGNGTLYVNSILEDTASLADINNIDSTNILRLGLKSDSTEDLNGLLKSVRIWNKALSQTEISNKTYNNIIPTGMVLEHKLNEGAGDTANDTSGNGNDGTITGATWSSDTPSKARKEVNGNLVPSVEDFPDIKNDVANTSSAFIGGVNAEVMPTWYATVDATAVSFEVDTAEKHSGTKSLKISTTDATGRGHAQMTDATGLRKPCRITVEPNTEYTLTAWIKTNNVADDSVYMTAFEYVSPGGAYKAQTATSKLSGTNDWTKITTVFTTNAASSVIYMTYYNNVAGNISDAWFDDIVLKPTTPTTRTAATGRTAIVC